MGLHICAVVQRGSSSLSEHVEIFNDGAEPVPVTGIELTDCAGAPQARLLVSQGGELGAGETAYVYSGEGTSLRTHTGDLMLYAGSRLPSGRTSRMSHTCATPMARSSTRCAWGAPRATPTAASGPLGCR
jgi:hypothetical protein